MNTLHLILTPSATKAIVTVDGVRVYPKTGSKTGFRSNDSYDFVTEKDSVRVRIFTLPHELLEPHWLLWAFVRYIISFFGIFNTLIRRDYYGYDFHCRIDISGETTVSLDQSRQRKGERVFDVIQGDICETEGNAFTFNELIPKRARLLRLLKIASWIAIAAVVVLICIVAGSAQ